jgi:DNA repair exonuclease SbcCD ATPase subunit
LIDDVHRLAEQSDDLIEKIRDELRHKQDEEKHRQELCHDLEQQLATLNEQLRSIDVNVDEQDDLRVRSLMSCRRSTRLASSVCSQAEWNRLEDDRKKLGEQQTTIGQQHQQINDELRRIQQDVQSTRTRRTRPGHMSRPLKVNNVNSTT